jgi:hypothetical protein
LALLIGAFDSHDRPIYATRSAAAPSRPAATNQVERPLCRRSLREWATSSERSLPTCPSRRALRSRATDAALKKGPYGSRSRTLTCSFCLVFFFFFLFVYCVSVCPYFSGACVLCVVCWLLCCVLCVECCVLCVVLCVVCSLSPAVAAQDGGVGAVDNRRAGADSQQSDERR